MIDLLTRLTPVPRAVDDAPGFVDCRGEWQSLGPEEASC